MSEVYSVGLDLGTTSISVAAVGADGRVLYSAGRPHHAALAPSEPGRSEQDPSILLDCSLAVLKDCLRHFAMTPHCVGVTGQMHSMLVCDNEDRPLTPVITWQDQRLLDRDERTGETYATQLEDRLKAGGCANPAGRVRPGYLAGTAFVLARTQKLPANSHLVCSVSDWFVSQLTGKGPVTDRTHAAATGLLDDQRVIWDRHICEALEIPVAMLPELRASGDPVGTTQSETAGRAGFESKTIVCCPVGDHQAAVLSALSDGEDAVVINLGTGGQLAVRTDHRYQSRFFEPRWIPRIGRRRTSDREQTGEDGEWLATAAGLCGGRSLQWLIDTWSDWIQAAGAEISKDTLWARLTKWDGAEELMQLGDPECRPWFHGLRAAPGERGEFRNVSTENFRPLQVYRAIVHGIASTMNTLLQEVQGAGLVSSSINRIRVAGNVPRKHPVVIRALESVCGATVELSSHAEEAACGAALLAASRCGLLSSARR